MNKRVYSLVLSDSVIGEIDRLAYLKNTSRSNLINQILADHLAYSTPEQRMQDIFEHLGRLLNTRDTFQTAGQLSSSMFSTRSALKYKYKPTVKYAVELYRNTATVVGELRVSFRTQSRAFISELNAFFKLWMDLENKYISKFFPSGSIQHSIQDGKFTRGLILPIKERYQTNEYIGQAIGEYIQMFDQILNIYFTHIENPHVAAEKAEAAYAEHLKKGIIIM